MREGSSARKREHEEEVLQAEADTVDDAIENLENAPPHPLMIVPRPMAYGAMVMGAAGALIGAVVGFGIGFAIDGFDWTTRVLAIGIVLTVAGLVGGGIAGGWSGSVGAKARDEMRPSYAGHARGTRPVRPEEPQPDKPIGWEK